MAKFLGFFLGALLAAGLIGAPASAVEPTFQLINHESEQSASFWFGRNQILFGNDLTGQTTNDSGLLFAFGNEMNLGTRSEYGFLMGNVVNFQGATAEDLFAFGNLVSLGEDAKIGRDVFVLSNKLAITGVNLPGDLSVASEKVTLSDVKIDGNLNLNVDELIVSGNVQVAGQLSYNETATITGLDRLAYGSLDVYESVEVDQSTLIVSAIYSKVISIAGLFLVMLLICLIWPKLHDRAAAQTFAQHFGLNLAFGLAALLLAPAAILMLFATMLGAPLALILTVIYIICIYLAQGFTGLWLGHLIIEKLFKGKPNAFLEAFVGIALLGLVALIPYLGAITGFLSLLFGLGFITNLIVGAIKKRPTQRKAKAGN